MRVFKKKRKIFMVDYCSNLNSTLIEGKVRKVLSDNTFLLAFMRYYKDENGDLCAKCNNIEVHYKKKKVKVKDLCRAVGRLEEVFEGNTSKIILVGEYLEVKHNNKGEKDNE
jgi:hypothetical protein